MGLGQGVEILVGGRVGKRRGLRAGDQVGGGGDVREGMQIMN